MDRLAKTLTNLAVRYLDPDAVVVFGSVAQGRARVDSDVDLLIVGPFRGPVERRGLDCREAISEFPVPVDVLLYSLDEFRSQAARRGSFAQSVSRAGVVVYARPGFDPTLLTVEA